MAITVTHVFEPTDDGVLNPKEFRRLVNECPGVKLPGVQNVIVYRHTCKQLIIASDGLSFIFTYARDYLLWLKVKKSKTRN